MKSRVIILLYAFCCIYINSNEQQWKNNMFSYDTQGYYMYLPAQFIKHDLKNVFLSDYDKKHQMYDKYPLGVAISELPFFLVAHGLCDRLNLDEPTGYTLPYQIAGMAATLFWVIFGLFILRKFLLSYFDDWVVAISLACIAFGTNLYTYTIFNPGMSHTVSFFIFSCILWYTRRWYQRNNSGSLYMLGFLVALAAITRPVNVIIALIPAFWEVNSLALLKERLRHFVQHKYKIIIAFFIFALVCFIQMSYWKYRQGRFVFYSYGDEGFDFLHPKIIRGLFGFRKGWFVYTPMAILIVAGFFSLRKMMPKLLPILLLYTATAIYLTFSWKNWWYGGGFSCRPLIESMAVFSLPLSCLIAQAVAAKKRIALVALTTIMAFFIALNTFQSYQYSQGILHWDRMTAKSYVYIFGKVKIDNKKNDKLLMTDQEVWQDWD